MRVRSGLVVALATSFVTSSSFAESPSHGADANIYFSRRGDASGGEGAGMIRPSLFTGSASMSILALTRFRGQLNYAASDSTTLAFASYSAGLT